MKLTNNTLLITGATSGIGRRMAEVFHDRGNRVIITGRRQALLDEITAQRPAITGFALNVNDTTALARCSAAIHAQFPHINVLIANAGISQPETVTADEWTSDIAEQIVMTNILGVIRVTAAFLPLLRRQPQATLMATSSALAFLPLASFPTYCASKAFLHSWLVSLRHQLRNTPVEVLEMLPPYLQTALTGDQQLNDPRAMPLDDYIVQILQMLENGPVARGELLLERDHARRWAERDGNFDAIFDMMNPR